MYADYFAELLRSFAVAPSRRGLLAALSGGLLTALPFSLGIDETAAKNNGRRQRKRKRQARSRKRKNQNQNPSPPPPPPGPGIHVDAVCPNTTGATLTANGDARMAQTFTAIGSGSLVRAEVEIFKVPGTVGDYILHLGAVDASGVPTNDVLAESVVANARVPDFGSILSFGFANPATVAVGTQYTLVLARPGSNQLLWVGSFDVVCAGRAFVSPNQTAPFAPEETDIDLSFTTFVSS